VGERDVPFAEQPRKLLEAQPPHPLTRLAVKYWAGPGRNVDRVLREGEDVAGFEVLEAPGHSPGHLAFWRESDGVLILGDVLNSINVLTGIRGLHEPPGFFTSDPEENRRSARRLAGLEPKLVLFGHGPPLRDTRKLIDFVDGLDGHP
jgi:hydroxyacylglutathione hydrolase